VEKTFAQSELEAIAAALADTSEGLTGTEIGHILASLKMADPAPTMTKWRRLHNAFVERQNYSQNRRAILQFIREAMKPERYAKQPERFEPMRANLNRALAFPVWPLAPQVSYLLSPEPKRLQKRFAVPMSFGPI
jgi:hypothetical protein